MSERKKLIRRRSNVKTVKVLSPREISSLQNSRISKRKTVSPRRNVPSLVDKETINVRSPNMPCINKEKPGKKPSIVNTINKNSCRRVPTSTRKVIPRESIRCYTAIERSSDKNLMYGLDNFENESITDIKTIDTKNISKSKYLINVGIYRKNQKIYKKLLSEKNSDKMGIRICLQDLENWMKSIKEPYDKYDPKGWKLREKERLQSRYSRYCDPDLIKFL